MKKTIGSLILAATLLVSVGCTQNGRTRNWGGTSEVVLDPGVKLINVTWKDTNMWMLTRPRTVGEKIETYRFTEKSQFGQLEGTIIIKER